MYFKEYDIIIDTIEENAGAEWNEVRGKLMKRLGLGSGQIGSIFKDYYPQETTINNYFKDRKAYRTMEAIISSLDRTKEEVAFQYGYKDYTVFFKWLKKIYGKSPKWIIEENTFSCPPVLHIKDIVSNDYALFSDNYVTKRDVTDQKWSELQLVDRITAMRNRISEINKEMRDEDDREKLGAMEMELLVLKRRIAEEEERLDMQVQEPVVIQRLTPGLYAEFIKIEECRTVYGISISKIIDLYNQSVEHNIPLDELCDIFCEKEFLSDIDDYYDEDDYLYDYEDPDMSYLIDEMSLAESWQYYKDDDAIDPYEGIDEPEEYDY